MDTLEVVLNNLQWNHLLESSYQEINTEVCESKTLGRIKLSVSSRMQNINKKVKLFEFTGGQSPKSLLFSLRVISPINDINIIDKYNLHDSSGALVYIEDSDAAELFINGVIVLDHGIFKEVLSSIKSTAFSSEIRLNLEDLKISESIHGKYIWDNNKSNRLKISHVQIIFHYRYSH